MIDLGNVDLTRDELKARTLVNMYLHGGVDIVKLAKMPGFEWIDEEFKKIYDKWQFWGAKILDEGGFEVTNWNDEIKKTRAEDTDLW